jgi:hypothetical protein
MEGTDLLAFWQNKMTVLDAIYEISAVWNLIIGTTLKKSWLKILPGNEAEFLDIDNLNEAVSETLIYNRLLAVKMWTKKQYVSGLQQMKI